VPSHEDVEDRLLDGVVRRAAGRVSPGRTAVSVMLARSDDVDELNGLAEQRRWLEWLSALETVRPHKDARRDAYRLHNLAVAHEAIADASSSVEDWRTRLTLAQNLAAQAAQKHPTEEYIVKAQARIAQSVEAYQRLAAMFAEAGTAPAPSPGVTPRATAARATPAASAAPAAPMSNQDVLDLRAAGLDDANLVAAVSEAKAVQFDLSPAGLKALLAGKVSNAVIAAMCARNPK
jgi:hypothetical protein